MGLRCIVDGCQTVQRKEASDNPENRIAVFAVIKNDLDKWGISMPARIKPPYGICELHFNPEDVIKKDVFTLPDGTTTELPRDKIKLKLGAKATIVIEPGSYLTVSAGEAENMALAPTSSLSRTALKRSLEDSNGEQILHDHAYNHAVNPKRQLLSLSSQTSENERVEDTNHLEAFNGNTNEDDSDDSDEFSNFEEVDQTNITNGAEVSGTISPSRSIDTHQQSIPNGTEEPSQSSHLSDENSDSSAKLSLLELRNQLIPEPALESWGCYFHEKKLIFGLLDKTTFGCKLKVAIDRNGHISLYTANSGPFFLDKQVNTNTDVLDCLQYAKSLEVCSGLGLSDTNSLKYAVDCAVFLMAENSYKRPPVQPRCLPCRTRRSRIIDADKRRTRRLAELQNERIRKIKEFRAKNVRLTDMVNYL